MERFKIVDVNPNDGVGGGGCVCSDNKVEGCDPPYAVFYATETDNNLSPHVVICAACLEAGHNACAGLSPEIQDAVVVEPDEPVEVPEEVVEYEPTEVKIG